MLVRFKFIQNMLQVNKFVEAPAQVNYWKYFLNDCTISNSVISVHPSKITHRHCIINIKKLAKNFKKIKILRNNNVLFKIKHTFESKFPLGIALIHL